MRWDSLTTSGGGLWQPESTALQKIRRDVDRKPHKFKRVLTDAGIRKAFLGNVAHDDKKAVTKFANLSSNKSNALKRNPKVSLFRIYVATQSFRCSAGGLR
jgi:uncharacterized protein (DUF2461 family)